MRSRVDASAWVFLMPGKACCRQMIRYVASAGDAGVAGGAVRAQDALQCLRRALHEAGEEEVGRCLPLRSSHECWRSPSYAAGLRGSRLLQRHNYTAALQLTARPPKQRLAPPGCKNTHVVICLCVAPWLQGLAAAYTASPSARLFACPF